MSGAVIVFGGTFDPVHNGHMTIARQALERSGMDAVWFLPTAVPPLREAASAPAAARLEMLHAATAGHPEYTVDDREVQRGGVSYTADTFDELRRQHPDKRFALLLGADVARSLPRWHRAGDLIRDGRFLIVNRSGSDALDAAALRRLGFVLERVQQLEVDSPAVSGSEVRRRVAAGQDIAQMVPAAVASVIRRLGLYRSAQPVHNADG